LTDRGHHTLRRIGSKNHRNAAAQVTAELNILFEDPVSTKTVRRELHKSGTDSRDAIAKPLITENNAQICKQWCNDHKTQTSDKQKCEHYMVR
jgi:guanylate kinase